MKHIKRLLIGIALSLVVIACLFGIIYVVSFIHITIEELFIIVQILGLCYIIGAAYEDMRNKNKR